MNRLFATPARPFAFRLAFAALYIALDAASFIEPLHGLNITPWNPAPALAMTALLRRAVGRPTVVATVLLSEFVIRDVPVAWWLTLASALLLAGGYLAVAALLSKLLSDVALIQDRRALLRWSGATILGTLLNSIVYLSGLLLCGMLPPEGWATGVVRFWVGDAVGIVVVMPLLWWLSDARGRALLRLAIWRFEAMGYAALSLVAVWIAFFLGDDEGFRLFYILFLPIVWASARHGMAGAIVSATLMQVGVIGAVRMLGFEAIAVAELQVLALVLALVGFFVGCVVDEQRLTSAKLRHSLRLAAAGEMAAALAHELNQPLTALSAYGSACEVLLARGESGARMLAAIRGMMAETTRAAEVVRRLRDFFQTGATKLEKVRLRGLIESAVTPFKARAQRDGVHFTISAIPEANLLADNLQLEVVLRNLLANAFEAVARQDPHEKAVKIESEVLSGGRVSIRVLDSGPGIGAKQAVQLFEAFNSTKSQGMGLGLAISQAIVEAHGGSLWGEVAPRGVFRIELPVAE